MEKSFWKAAMTNTSAAKKTTAKAATPARRAVSLRRADEASLSRTSATSPARKEYAHSASASRRAKLPICDMGIPEGIFSETWHPSNRKVRGFEPRDALRAHLAHCGADGCREDYRTQNSALAKWMRRGGRCSRYPMR